MAIRKFIDQREATKNKKNNKLNVEDILQEQTNTKSEQQVGNTENLNLKSYLHLKINFFRNLQGFTTADEARFVKTTVMREMLMEEIDFLTQLLEKQ